MRVAALIPLLGCIWNLALAFFVLTRASRAVQNRVYFFLGLFISVWNLGQFFNFTTPASNPEAADFWVRFVWLGVLFIPLLLFHLSMLLTQTRTGKFIPVMYVLLSILALTLPTNFFITGVRYLGLSGWYAKPAMGLHLGTAPFALMFVAIVILIRKRRTLPQMYRSRLTALIVAQSMLAVLGTNDTLPLNGFDNYPGTQFPVYPIGSIAAVFYGIIVAYSVLQHHLLDVQIGFSRIAAQLVRITFLTGTALTLLLIATLIFPNAFDLRSLWIAAAVFVVTIVAGLQIFPRLFGGSGMEKWERRILGDHFEYQDRIRAFTEGVVWHSDLVSLVNGLHELFTRVFRLERYWLILRDDTLRSFVLARAHPEEPQAIVSELKVPSPVFAYFEADERHQWLNLGRHQPSRSTQPSERLAREQLERFPAEFVFPLRWENELFGLILIGNKLDAEPITATDLNLLADLTRRLGLVVNQIRLKDEVLRTQELELLGRMSRGMAHDLNNLLTPIWTLLQLASEGQSQERFDDELLDVALRNTQTVRAYIKEALFFSEHLRPDLQLGRLDMLIAQAVDLGRTNRKKDVQIIATTPGEVLVEMDEVLIQRLLGNLISNAVDASQPGAEVRVELERLVKTEAARDWLRIRVIDHGEGIPKENLERVVTPYFTTKNRGDEGRGFGLGLAICRKIAALHGGHLTIRSQVKKGTVVQLDLPSRQNKQPVHVPSAA